MNWMKMIRSVLLCAALTFSLGACPAYAAGEEGEAAPAETAGEQALLLAEETAFSVGGSGYSDLKTALENAASGSIVVMTAPSYTLTESVAIPSGVTLLLPYSDSALTVSDGSASLPYANSAPNGSSVAWTGPGENALHTLVLGENVTVTVGSGAKLVLGGQYTSSSSGLGGQTCGAHSDMVLSAGSRILVQDGGILSAMGYITGSGSIAVSTGGKVYEPFVVTDYHGGTYTVVLYMTKNQTPFNSYAMINIQCPMTMDGSSYLYGYCDLYAGDGHNTTTALMVGPADAVLNLASGTEASFSYDESCKVDAHYGVGKTTLSIDGDAALGYMTLTVSNTTVKTNTVPFPIPYNLTVIQQSGTLSVDYGVKLLPGAEVVVREGATLQLIKEKSALLVYEGFDPRDYGAVMYPNAAALSAAGLSERARLIVDGELKIGSKGTFAGLAETSGTGLIHVYADATLAASPVEGGCAGDAYFDYAINATTQTGYHLTARVGDYRSPGGYLQLEAGKKYYAANGDTVESAGGYTYDLYTGPGACTAVTAAYATAQTVRGTWATGFTVTFDANGGAFADGSTVVVSEELKPGKAVAIPDAPTRTDGTFVCWENCPSSPKVLRGDVVYKAQWKVGFGLEGRILSSVGGAVTLETTVSNHTSQAGTCTLLAAVYDKDDRMISAQVLDPFTVDGGAEHTGSFTLDLSGAPVKVKLFLTDGGYAPAAQALPLPIS